MTKWCIHLSLYSADESSGPAPLSPSELVCKVDDDYSRHGDIYLVFASQLTMQNQMTGMRLKGLNAKAEESFDAEYLQTDYYSRHGTALLGG